MVTSAFMRYDQFIERLDAEALEAYAERAGTTSGYVRAHIASRPPRKIPRRALMRALWLATDGAVSWREFLAHFYGPEPIQIEEDQHDRRAGRPSAGASEGAGAVTPGGGSNAATATDAEDAA